MATVAVVLVPLFGLLLASAANAHDGDSSVVYLDVYPDGTAQGQIEHPVSLLNDLFGLDLDPQNATIADIAEIEPAVRAYNVDNLAIVTEDGADWGLDFTGEVEAIETESEVYAAFAFDVDTVFDEAPRIFAVTFDGIVQDRTHFASVVMRTDPVTGTFLNEGEAVPGQIRFDAPTLDVNLDDPDMWKAFTGTVALGMEHIFIGTDHILFILVLIFPAVMLFSLSEGWKPVPSFRAGLWRILKIATAFTIAHSITLTLGGLEIIELPSKFVETVIALSIMATAVHNIRPIFANREAAIAFAFGIFHGFGFAGLLSDLGIGRGQRVLSLLGFNIGVEIGQAFIILLLFPGLYLLRRTLYYPWVLRIGSITLGLIAAIWAVERIFETSLGIDDLLEKFTRAPRVFTLVAIFTAIAAGVRQVEAARGCLVSIPSDDDSDTLPGGDRDPGGDGDREPALV